ncbi:MAG: hypothetical protein GY861_11380 [bacterium]|nr:hypothetical protein [bacterium]
MFKFWSRRPVNNKAKTPEESKAIATPRIVNDFKPVEVVAPTQGVPGEFSYHSATWKYLQNYFNHRIIEIHKSLESPKRSFDKTQVLRGQIKEINLLLKHTNKLAGIDDVSPTNNSPGMMPADGGFTNE